MQTPPVPQGKHKLKCMFGKEIAVFNQKALNRKKPEQMQWKYKKRGILLS